MKKFDVLGEIQLIDGAPANPANVAKLVEKEISGISNISGGTLANSCFSDSCQKTAAPVTPPSSNSDPAFWQLLAESGKTDQDVDSFDEALFLFALRKIQNTPSADQEAMRRRFYPCWKQRLHAEAFKVLSSASLHPGFQREQGQPLPTDQSETEENDTADQDTPPLEWQSPYPHKCACCFRVDTCDQPARWEFGLQLLHLCGSFTKKGQI